MSGDLLWDYVVLLTGFEGSDGSTVFEDESTYGQTLAARHGAQITTSVFKSGASCFGADGVNDYVQITRTDDLYFGADDFTVEAWARKPSGTSYEVICCHWNITGTQSWILEAAGNGNVRFRCSGDGTAVTSISGTITGYTVDTFYHYAATRRGDTIYLYANGEFIGSASFSGALFENLGMYLQIGARADTADAFTGYIDEVRFTKAAARYFGEDNYTIPDAPFPRSGPAAGADLGGGDPIITLACFLKMELPERNVLLSDGGQLRYNSEVYRSCDDDFGALHAAASIDASFGDLSEGGEFVLAPPGDVDPVNWWRSDLADCRVRIWMGTLDADNYNVTTPTLLADLLTDTYERRRGAGGEDLLAFDLMGRAEKLFLANEGNVCSQRFHQSVWPGEKGMNNCRDVSVPIAWGAASPDRGTSSSGSSVRNINFSLSGGGGGISAI